MFSETSNLLRQSGKYDAATAATEAAVRMGDGFLAANPNDLEVVEQAGADHLDLARLRQQNGHLKAPRAKRQREHD